MTRRRVHHPGSDSSTRAPASPLVVRGLEFATGSGIIDSVSGEALRGADAGYWIGLVFHGIAAFSGQIIDTGNLVASDGYSIFFTGATSLQFRHYNAAAAAITRTPNFVGTTTGKTHIFLAWYDGTNINCSLNGVEVGNTAAVGYNDPGATDHMDVGVRGNHSSTFTGGTLVGVVGGDGVSPSSAERTAWRAATKSKGYPAEIPGKTDHIWTPELWDGTTLTDRIGAEDLVVASGSVATQEHIVRWA